MSPQAYFIDNLKAAAAGTRTPPDWWRELRKQEERRRHPRDESPPEDASIAERAFEDFLQSEAKDSFDRILHRVLTDLVSNGQSEHAARANADYVARMNLRAKFRKAHPEFRD